MAPKSTFITSIQPPPGPSANLVLPSDTSTNTNPTIFNDAMIIRKSVFIDEQHCTAESEIDSDDARSWHWVLYDNSTATSTPAGVIRLVPPPQAPHAHLTEPSAAQGAPEYDWAHEPCIKLTRVAIMPSFRGLGLGRQLVETALEWAAVHAADIDEGAAQIAARGQSPVTPIPWRGLVLVHAQVDVEGMYAGLGFETDHSLGRWHEEGIEHVGMFRRVVLDK
ncbi:Acyl-CoA N-acyltransferase [Penicillium robsamsonii]|uniref:Acyl-CoA N-acyltransferase n=1 Tax=Penicillium robsamsonii TaxID=1792511 RepID=UPI0025481CB5|nr:Acyl-CoA N-acyltransferase [Penicillium robsamsonii]KAJ5826486.1 Acyl-CoA N-acyltransferase [Penicillium robsamsonii]